MKNKDLDAKLKDLLTEKSKNGYAIITSYISDTEQKNRKNTKRAKNLEKFIIEQNLFYKKVEIQHNKNEVEYDFIIFQTPQHEEKPIKEFLEECNRNFRNFTLINESIEKFLEDKKFDHPIIQSQKDNCIERNEILITDIYGLPDTVNGWRIRSVSSENSFLYECGSVLCSISLQPDGRWKNHYGTIRPVGASIKKEFFESREEAIQNLKHPFKSSLKK